MLVLELDRAATIGYVAFASGGRTLVAAGGSEVYWWRDVADRARAERLPNGASHGNARFTADGCWVFTGTTELYRIDPHTGASAVLRLWRGFNTKFDVSPTAPLVLVAQTFRENEAWSTRMALWRAEDPSPAGRVWERNLTDFNYFPLQFFAGGARFARVEYDANRPRGQRRYRVVIHDTATGAPIAVCPVAIRALFEWALGHDGNLFAAKTTNQIELYRLDAPDAGPVRLRNDGPKHFTGIALHPAGRLLAAASNDHTVKLYDTTTGDVVRALTWQLGRMRSVCFSPDGTLAAAGSDTGQVVVWDVDL